MHHCWSPGFKLGDATTCGQSLTTVLHYPPLAGPSSQRKEARLQKMSPMLPVMMMQSAQLVMMSVSRAMAVTVKGTLRLQEARRRPAVAVGAVAPGSSGSLLAVIAKGRKQQMQRGGLTKVLQRRASGGVVLKRAARRQPEAAAAVSSRRRRNRTRRPSSQQKHPQSSASVQVPQPLVLVMLKCRTVMWRAMTQQVALQGVQIMELLVAVHPSAVLWWIVMMRVRSRERASPLQQVRAGEG